ncbi:hypothetical protein BYT27DRAFT_7299323, partial [Phlegmacium glaucopus]
WTRLLNTSKAELKGHSHWVRSAVFSPDGMHIVSASEDCTAWLWNTATGECEAVLKGHPSVLSLCDTNQLSLVSLIPDGMFINTDFNGHIRVFHRPSFLYICKDTILHTISLQRIWVPPPFHSTRSFGFHKSKICLWYGSGEFLLLEVSMVIIFYDITSLLTFSLKYSSNLNILNVTNFLLLFGHCFSIMLNA